MFIWGTYPNMSNTYTVLLLLTSHRVIENSYLDRIDNCWPLYGGGLGVCIYEVTVCTYFWLFSDSSGCTSTLVFSSRVDFGLNLGSFGQRSACSTLGCHVVPWRLPWSADKHLVMFLRSWRPVPSKWLSSTQPAHKKWSWRIQPRQPRQRGIRAKGAQEAQLPSPLHLILFSWVCFITYHYLILFSWVCYVRFGLPCCGFHLWLPLCWLDLVCIAWLRLVSRNLMTAYMQLICWILILRFIRW